MLLSRLKIAAGMLLLALVSQTWAADTPDRMSAEKFDRLRTLIKPKPGGFDDLPWMTDLWEARKKAAAEGKPLLVWVGDGHPLGWT